MSPVGVPTSAAVTVRRWPRSRTYCAVLVAVDGHGLQHTALLDRLAELLVVGAQVGADVAADDDVGGVQVQELLGLGGLGGLGGLSAGVTMGVWMVSVMRLSSVSRIERTDRAKPASGSRRLPALGPDLWKGGRVSEGGDNPPA